MSAVWRWGPLIACLLAFAGVLWVTLTTTDGERLIVTASMSLALGALAVTLIDRARR